jgi:RecB family endonuclease NucS
LTGDFVAVDYGVRVRLVIARCSVDYVGRLTAHLPSAVRLLMVKADNSVLVHSDGGSYKPLNWMSPPCWTVEEPGRWVVQNKAGEQLLITLDEVLHDSRHDLGIDPGLVKDGVEAHLQVLLAEHVATLGDGWSLVRREFPTPIGPVDLMCRDASGLAVPIEVGAGERSADETVVPGERSADEAVVAGQALPADSTGRYVAVEIKRKATIDAVEQLTRYLEYLNRDPMLAPVSGVLAAQSIAPQAKTLAEDRGIRCVLLDYDALRGIAHEGTLF